MKNKILAIILIILLIITAITLYIYFYPRFKFSYENVKTMLESAETEFSNVYQRVEMYSENDTMIGYYDIYKKDHLTYTYEFDIEANESSEIYQDDKEISVNPYWILQYLEEHKVKCAYSSGDI